MQTFYLYYSSRTDYSMWLNGQTLLMFYKIQKRMGHFKYMYILQFMEVRN